MSLLTRLGLVAAATAFAVLIPQTAYAAAPDTVVDSGPDDDYLLPGPVQFTFHAVGTSDGFLCSVDAETEAQAVYTACTSPQTFDLPYGSHWFRVKAKNAAEVDATPVVRFWYIRNVPCEEAGEDYTEAQGWYFYYENKKSTAHAKLKKAIAAHNQKLIDKYEKKYKKYKKKAKEWKAKMKAATEQSYAVC